MTMLIATSQTLSLPETDIPALLLYAMHCGYDWKENGESPSQEDVARRVLEREGYEGLALAIRAGRFQLRRGRFPKREELVTPRGWGEPVPTHDVFGNRRSF